MTKTVIITGSNGFLGSHITQLLDNEDESYNIITVGRTSGGGDTHIHYDYLNESDKSLEHIRNIIDSVVQCDDNIVAILHLAAKVEHSRDQNNDIYRINVDYAVLMADLASTYDVQYIVASTSGVLPNSVTPDSNTVVELKPHWPYYHSKALMEYELGGRDNITIIRPPMLLGPGIGTESVRCLDTINRFISGDIPFTPPGYIAYADVRNVARLFVDAIPMRGTNTFNVSGTHERIFAFFTRLSCESGISVPSQIPIPAQIIIFLCRLLAMFWFLPIGKFFSKYQLKLEMAMCGWNVCDKSTHTAFPEIDWISPSTTIGDTVKWLNEQKSCNIIYPPKRDFDVIGFKQKMNLRGWGYADSNVTLEDSGFFFNGNRYDNVSNNPLPKFKGFCDQMVPKFDAYGVQNSPVKLEPTQDQIKRDADRNSMVQYALCGLENDIGIEVNTEYIVRVNGSHGQELTEIHTNINNSFRNIADMVVFPETKKCVLDIVSAARTYGIVLIPFGGGTNVSRCLEIPDHCMDYVVCVVNMTAYCSVERIDKSNMMACVQSGATGNDLEMELGKYGFMFGHQPDSCEFSTMGGWISTNASGMKKNRYGNIEDNVISVEWVDGNGQLSSYKNHQRTALGPNSSKIMFGSEGNFGIILSCVIRIHPLPESTDYDSWVFPNMKEGIKFMKDVSETDSWPASLRLMNNEQFRLGQSFKPPASRLKSLIDPLLKFVLTRVKGFDLMEMAASTIVYEGSKEQIAMQRGIIARCAGKHGGMSGGSSSGKDGYNVTFAVAYIRDCLYKYGIMGETIECSVSWSDLDALLDGVTDEFHTICDDANITNKFFCYRVSQIYKEGVCVYCTFGLPLEDTKRDIDVFAGIERATRLSILRYGGSLSHHHGIGKLRSEFIADEFDKSDIDVMMRIKDTVDPDNIFANGNGIFAW